MEVFDFAGPAAEAARVVKEPRTRPGARVYEDEFSNAKARALAERVAGRPPDRRRETAVYYNRTWVANPDQPAERARNISRTAVERTDWRFLSRLFCMSNEGNR